MIIFCPTLCMLCINQIYFFPFVSRNLELLSTPFHEKNFSILITFCGKQKKT